MTTITAARSRHTAAQPVPSTQLVPRNQPTPSTLPNQPVHLNAGVMLAAYLLSVVSTAMAVLDGTASAGFGANDVATYAFYSVSFAFFGLALSRRRGAQVAVAVFLVLQLATGVLVHPDDVGPTGGWWENAGYLGLLAVALGLTVRRITGRSRA